MITHLCVFQITIQKHLSQLADQTTVILILDRVCLVVATTQQILAARMVVQAGPSPIHQAEALHRVAAIHPQEVVLHLVAVLPQLEHFLVVVATKPRA